MKGLLALLSTLFLVNLAPAQSGSNSLRVFFDCSFNCDSNFLKEGLPVVDWLNEATQADVHILHNRQTTGSGGDRVTLTFLGRRTYAAMGDTLAYATSGDATSDDERRALLKHVSIGLTRYLARAGLSDQINVTAVQRPQTEEKSNSIETDPWNYWVFSVGGSGSLNGQASSESLRRSGNMSANRTTEELKIRFSGNLNYNRSEFDTGEDVIVSSTRSESLFGQVVKSVGGQWAVGATGRVSASSFQNTKLQMEFGPAIEYDFFPYSESTRRYLTVQYGIKIQQRDYEELTIFALERETILRHYLEASLSLSQTWGSASLSADFGHLLTNFDRSLKESYNFGLFGSARVRLFKGLSFNAFASYNRIRDQLDLRANSASKEEILLRAVQLPTGYSYFLNFGFTYRFGSIFNNVVNPRMGGGGGGNVIFF